MNTIWKYTLQANRPDVINMPIGAQVLSANTQTGEDINIWCKVEPCDRPPDELTHQDRRFWTFGTGHEIPDHLSLMFIDTVMLRDGRLVFHVFEEV